MISIIIPVYNGEKYISNCLDSILQQSYRNIEVVVIDDKSNDRTVEICESYVQRDERVKIIHKKKNEGSQRARALGVGKCCGKFIMFVDCDDFLKPGILEELHNNVSQFPVDIICFNYIAKGKLGFIIDEPEVLELKEAVRNILIMKKLDGNTWAKLYNAELFSKNDILFYENRNSEFLTIYDLFQVSKKIMVIPFCGYHYNQVQGSQSRSRYVHPEEEDFYQTAYQFTQEILGKYPDMQREVVFFKFQVLLYICIQMEKDFKFKRTNERFVAIKKEIRKNVKQILLNQYFGCYQKINFCLVYTNLFRVVYKCYWWFKGKRKNSE